MIYKMRMGDSIEINLVPLGFSFKELSNQIKQAISSKSILSNETMVFRHFKFV